jgi:hypothetical protein
LIGGYEALSGLEIHCLLAKAAKADMYGSEYIRDEYARDFGHYLAMMSLGHGVSWFDNHARFDLKVPLTEFYL